MAHDPEATVIGFVGITLMLLAYLLNLFKLMRTDRYPYAVLNCVGAALACYSSYLIRFMPFVILEGVWAIAAGVAIARKALTQRDSA